MLIACPRCQSATDFPANLANAPVKCPRCNGTFRLPAQMVALPPMPVSQPEPSFTVRIASDPATRIKPQGWFSRGLAGAAGVLLVLFLFLSALAGGAYWAVNNAIDKASRKIESVTSGTPDEQAEAIEATRKILGTYALEDVSEDAEVTTITLDPTASHSISGACRRGNKSHRFVLFADRRKFKGATEWVLVRLLVDGKQVVPIIEQP